MKFVVIGATGLIGSKLTELLRARGHEVVAASPSTGVNTLTGEGVAAALAGAHAVVDVTNSPSLDGPAAQEFFATSSRVLLAAEKAAGIRHHVVLSIVGVDRLPDSGYFVAKVTQERLVAASDIPYSILRSTQFFEFVGRIADAASDGKEIRITASFVQPVLSDDTVAALADVAQGTPLNGITEVAGPDKVRLDGLVRQLFAARKNGRPVVTDESYRYFGAKLDDASLVPARDSNARIGATKFVDWLAGGG